MKSLYVAGSYDDLGGSPSRVAAELLRHLPTPTESQNGGHFQDLQDLLDTVDQYNVVYWFANIPNDKPKLVAQIKKKNPTCLLVTSKRNDQEQYSFLELVNRALLSHSNLLVEFLTHPDGYQARLLDPLGNVYLDRNRDMALLGGALEKRVTELLSCTRYSSSPIEGAVLVPNEEDFFEIVRNYGTLLHDFVHGAHPERFLGNASFRCLDGFPSFQQGEFIYASMRNLDKRKVGQATFVPVRKSLPVQYYGACKPSVDTPIHLQLYQAYPEMRYMLHTHAYIAGAPFTEKLVPCGAIEEAEEIRRVYPTSNGNYCEINLRGHGSLVLSGSVAFLRNLHYIPRPIPEIHPEYARTP